MKMLNQWVALGLLCCASASFAVTHKEALSLLASLKDRDKPLSAIAIVTITNLNQEAFEKVIPKLRERATREDGNTIFASARVVGSSVKYSFYTAWKTADALAKHLDHDTNKDLKAEVLALTDGSEQAIDFTIFEEFK